MFAPLFFIGLSACSGEDGMDGEEGAQGIQGIQGPIGEKGVGPVIYSDWFDAPFPDELPLGYSSFKVIAPSITEAIMNEGTVMVYGRDFDPDDDDDFTNIQILPVIHNRVKLEYGFSIEAIAELTIYVRRDGLNPTNYYNQFRYVIIPGSVASQGQLSKYLEDIEHVVQLEELLSIIQYAK